MDKSQLRTTGKQCRVDANYGRNKGLGCSYVTGGEIRVYGGNKGAREFSCGQRDLCRLSEAQPQAGNSMEKT